MHIAPPCGTASRAREIPLSRGRGPQPLRNDLWPLGLPGLNKADQARVDSANAIYVRAANFCLWLREQAAQHGLPSHFCVENPLRSYMWMIPEFVRLKPQCLHIAYDVCMHGGDRDKHQMLWTSMGELQALESAVIVHIHIDRGGARLLAHSQRPLRKSTPLCFALVSLRPQPWPLATCICCHQPQM